MTSYLINIYLFTFLPTDPASIPLCSVEQGVNLAWPKVVNSIILSKPHSTASSLAIVLQFHSDHHEDSCHICSTISLGFYFILGSGNLASNKDRPLLRTIVYKIVICHYQQLEVVEMTTILIRMQRMIQCTVYVLIQAPLKIKYSSQRRLQLEPKNS